jgi:hypothetical protein
MFKQLEEKVMVRSVIILFLIGMMVLSIAACSPKIYGTVQILDTNMMPLLGENPKGTVVNIINTTATLEEASHSVIVNEEGRFESPKNTIKPGIYKVEANRIGFMTETQTVEIDCCSSKEVDLSLKRIPMEKRKSIEASISDEDKIINPGEVNIQPPIL